MCFDRKKNDKMKFSIKIGRIISVEMDVHKSLLGKFKLSEVKVDPIFDEKGKSHDAPPVFSAKFWADPSLVSVVTYCTVSLM